MFGFGGGKSRTTSTGSARAYGSSVSGSISGGMSEGGSTSTSRQALAFEDVFARLFGGAEGAAAGLDPSLLTGAADQLFSGGLNFLESIGNDAGSGYLEDRVSGQSPVLDEQIAALQQDTGRLFREELLPGITSEAVASGTLGGGRQGVAQGLAASRVADAFAQGATALRAGDIANRDAAASTLAGNAISGAQVGLGGLSGLYGLAQGGFSADLAPYQALAGILGGPQVLTQADSESFQSAEDFANAFSRAFNFSRSDTRTDSRSANFSFSPV